jgi:hypothetical protein
MQDPMLERMPTIQAKPPSPSSIAWHRNIRIRQARMIAKLPPLGWFKTAKTSSAPTF